jgi:hypothetical protein
MIGSSNRSKPLAREAFLLCDLLAARMVIRQV